MGLSSSVSRKKSVSKARPKSRTGKVARLRAPTFWQLLLFEFAALHFSLKLLPFFFRVGAQRHERLKSPV
jgi:hypothetical protein